MANSNDRDSGPWARTMGAQGLIRQRPSNCVVFGPGRPRFVSELREKG